MSGALYTHTTRASGTILTAAIYNGDHQDHITYGDAQYLGGWSNSVAQMRIQTDPGESGSENLGSSISDEIEQLRYAILELKQAADSSLLYWYQSPIDLAGTSRLPARYIDGLEISVQASSPGFIEVATGVCRSQDDTINMRVSSPRHRSVTALWVTAATGGGVGVSWTKFIPYHVFVIKTAANIFDIGFDTVLTASNILARASGTKYRRIGSVNTSTQVGTIRPMVQYQNDFIYQSPKLESPTYQVPVPSGNQANALVQCPALPSGLVLKVHLHAWATGAARWTIQDAGATYALNEVAQAFGGNVVADQVNPQDGHFWTTVSGAVRYSAFNAASPVKLITLGWMDPRTA